MAEVQEHRMGTMPIPKLLIIMAIPAIISMFVQACYNVVDSIFVAQLSEAALTSVSLAFPVQLLIVSLSVGLGVGMNSGISRRLGEKKIDLAEQIAEHGFVLAIIISLIVAVIGLLLPYPFAGIFTNVPEIVNGCGIYLTICCVFAFGVVLTQAGFATMQGSGDMIQPMIGQLIGAITNIILDPIFIFGYFGVPAFGVAGAAIATVAGQILSMIYILAIVAFRKSNILHPSLRKFKFNPELIRDIITVGVPSAVMQGIGSVMVTLFNLILAQYGTTAMAVFGVFFKVQSFVFMPVFGLCQGAMPIYGYNYGARKPERFLENAKVAIIICECFMVVGLIMFQFFPQQLLGMFNASDDMMAIGVRCFHIISWLFPFAGMAIPLTNAFQAVGKAYVSMISSFLRQIILLIPFAWLFSMIGGLDWVWASFVVADAINLLYILYEFYKLKRDQLDPMARENALQEG